MIQVWVASTSANAAIPASLVSSTATVPSCATPAANRRPTVPNSSAVFPALPPRVDITDGNTNFFRDSGEIPQYNADPTDSIATKKRKRTMFLVIAAAALAVLAFAVLWFRR